jgi:hypothetical protein
MVAKYRELQASRPAGPHPPPPLSFSSLQRELQGDVNALRRLFDFLEAIGAINGGAISGGGGGPSGPRPAAAAAGC